MVQRTQRTSGKAFYGCRRYPQCKGTLPVRETGQADLPGLDAERVRLLDALYRERCETTRLAQQVQALRVQVERLTPAPLASSVERQILVKTLTHLLTVVHPDRWQDHPCATELTKHVNTLRNQLKEGMR
jgi:ssDNA-binding Zn-finger/Zn-ribbon topoisomerase 1